LVTSVIVAGQVIVASGAASVKVDAGVEVTS